MTLNVLQIDDTMDAADTRVLLPAAEALAGDTTVSTVIPPWTRRYVPKDHDLMVIPIRARHRARGYMMFPEVGRFITPEFPHRRDLIAVSNGTVTFFESRSVLEPMIYQAGSFKMIVYPASPSTAESDFMFGGTEVVSFSTPADPLEGYEVYAKPDWDGYDAVPITPQTLATARAILKILPRTFGEPECSPGADGSIGFEWIMGDGPLRKLFIDIGPGRAWKAYRRLANGHTDTITRKPISLGTAKGLASLFERLGV